MASSSNETMMMMVLGLVVIGVGVYFFRCKLGIAALCPGGDTSVSGAGTSPTVATTSGSTTSTTTTGGTAAQQISAESGFPAVSLTEGMQYIANQIVNDIDKNTFQQFTSNFVLNLEADILERHKDDLSLIYNYNGMSLQPMQGRSLAAYSQLVLTVARESGIALNPAYEAMLRSNLFAGSPVVVNNVTPITANMAISVA